MHAKCPWRPEIHSWYTFVKIKHLVLKSSRQRFAQQFFLSFWWTGQVKTCKSCCKPIYPFPVTTSLIEIGFHLHFLFPTRHKNNMCLFDTWASYTQQNFQKYCTNLLYSIEYFHAILWFKTQRSNCINYKDLRKGLKTKLP
jgi:hypothetical protein